MRKRIHRYRERRPHYPYRRGPNWYHRGPGFGWKSRSRTSKRDIDRDIESDDEFVGEEPDIEIITTKKRKITRNPE